MFGEALCLDLVNGDFASALATPIAATDLPTGGPRVLSRLEALLTSRPLASDVRFNHYRPARFCSENAGSLEPLLSPEALQQFENVFATLNAMLP
jgi:hypothetical protein